MIVLYSAGGSSGLELSDAAGDPASFQTLKQHAIALLIARGQRRAAALLSQFPFSMRDGGNDFNDEFFVLHAPLPLAGYEAARVQREVKEDRAAYASIAALLSEIGPYVRFIAVSLDTRRQLPHQQGLKEAQIKKLVFKYIGVTNGYLGDFSYQAHADFYTELDLDLDPYKYQGTTRERFVQILSKSPPNMQATILDGILQRFPVTSTPARTRQLADEIRNWAIDLRSGPVVAHPTPQNATETVRRALADAEHLIQKNGATSAVDRVHTALHGYQLGLCAEISADVPPDSSLTQAFKILRKHHPALQATGHRAQDIDKILNSLGAILDAMNLIRNRASVAHPNETLLDEVDARLAINIGRTIFHYLDHKIDAWRKRQTDAAKTIPAVLTDDDVPF